MTKVEISEIKDRMRMGEDITIIDARSAEAWASSDVKAGGAIRVPPDDAEKHIADVKRDSYVLVYCT